MGVTVKTFFLIVFLSHLHQTEVLLEKLDERLQSDKDRYKIHKAVARCNYIFLIYAQLYLGYALSRFVAGIFVGEPPWLIYNPFLDWRHGIASLWTQSVLEYTLMTILVAMVLISDTYAIVFVIIFRAHIEVLKDHIRSLRSDPLKTDAEHYEELVGYIIDHKLVLQCCNLMRPLMSRTLFVQLLLIGAVIGITLFNVLYFSGIFHGISSIIFLLAVLLETFPFCYLCDLLVKDCEELSNLLAQSHWLGAEPRYKSTLRIFMHNVQQPIVFIAGGIFSISMNNNIKMAKFAFTVMTLVKKMNLADRFQS